MRNSVKNMDLNDLVLLICETVDDPTNSPISAYGPPENKCCSDADYCRLYLAWELAAERHKTVAAMMAWQPPFEKTLPPPTDTHDELTVRVAIRQSRAREQSNAD